MRPLLIRQTGSKAAARDVATLPKGVSEKNTLEQETEERIIRELAEDINSIIKEKQARTFVAMPDMIFKRVFDHIDFEAKEKIFKSIEKDLMKVDKTDLPEVIQQA